MLVQAQMIKRNPWNRIMFNAPCTEVVEAPNAIVANVNNSCFEFGDTPIVPISDETLLKIADEYAVKGNQELSEFFLRMSETEFGCEIDIEVDCTTEIQDLAP